MDILKHTFGFIQIKWILVTVTILSSLLSPVLSKTALLIIDVQNCFLPGGTLAVSEGDAVIPVINNIRRQYENKIDLTVLSQDWHCKNHVSFASEHVGYSPYSVIPLSYDSEGKLCENNNKCTHTVNQTLWPDHCVIDSTDANFSTKITREPDDIVVRKGYNCQVDSYSAFFDNGGFSKTELEDVLHNHGITKVIVTGLALDFCVYYTSKDAKKIGLEVYTVVDACRPVNPSDVTRVLKDLRSIGVHVVNSSDLDEAISASNSLNHHVFQDTFWAYLLITLTLLHLN